MHRGEAWPVGARLVKGARKALTRTRLRYRIRDLMHIHQSSSDREWTRRAKSKSSALTGVGQQTHRQSLRHSLACVSLRLVSPGTLFAFSFRLPLKLTRALRLLFSPNTKHSIHKADGTHVCCRLFPRGTSQPSRGITLTKYVYVQFS